MDEVGVNQHEKMAGSEFVMDTDSGMFGLPRILSEIFIIFCGGMEILDKQMFLLFLMNRRRSRKGMAVWKRSANI